MQQSLLVDLSVLFVPGKDETFPSIKVFLVKLWKYLSLRPSWKNHSIFFPIVFVVVVSANDYDNFVALERNDQTNYVSTFKTDIHSR